MNRITNELYCIQNECIKIIMYKKWTYKNEIIKNECIKNELIKKRTDPPIGFRKHSALPGVDDNFHLWSGNISLLLFPL